MRRLRSSVLYVVANGGCYEVDVSRRNTNRPAAWRVCALTCRCPSTRQGHGPIRTRRLKLTEWSIGRLAADDDSMVVHTTWIPSFWRSAEVDLNTSIELQPWRRCQSHRTVIQSCLDDSSRRSACHQRTDAHWDHAAVPGALRRLCNGIYRESTTIITALILQIYCINRQTLQRCSFEAKIGIFAGT